ncbi:MAG TPA: hypothetical protein VKZ87_05335 [Ferrovibrio sp.]|uniref:hypothetical protein n=1 Tax=Ferrovibrio sp. TaxID=1917215 RepID=UPI002B4B1F0C|nr:hypothetical protein [Ferrovibrio sp.]HLT76791.1 hypothetical protein [Ferrovibrio sp.]
MKLEPRFFSPIGTLRHAERLNFLSKDVRAAGTVMGFFGAAAALGARPEELVLLVCRRHSPADLHRQVVLVFQPNRGLTEALTRLYRAHGRPLGFEGQQRWCAIPEPGFLRDETFALLAAHFPTLLMIEETAAGDLDIAVHASSGFKSHPKLKLAPLGDGTKPAVAAAPAAKVTPLPRSAAAPTPQPQPITAPQAARPAQVVPLRPRRLKSGVALNEHVERRVVNEFRRLLQMVALHS